MADIVEFHCDGVDNQALRDRAERAGRRAHPTVLTGCDVMSQTIRERGVNLAPEPETHVVRSFNHCDIQRRTGFRFGGSCSRATARSFAGSIAVVSTSRRAPIATAVPPLIRA